MSKFNIGDVVKRKNGERFSDGNLYNTVREPESDKFYPSPTVVWVKNGWIGADYIELVNNSPIRETTVVKKEIVPGTYGDVKIWPAGTICIPGMSGTDKKRLAEAIKTLQQIHDAME